MSQSVKQTIGRDGHLAPKQIKEYVREFVYHYIETDRRNQLRDQIVRDVRTAWLQANTGYQRIGVTAQLLKQANLSLQRAQTRYQLGLSSIVELRQAQLQQTSAAIDNTKAQYQYRLSLATLNYQIGTHP